MMEYRGHTVRSGEFHGPDAKRRAWDDFLAKFVATIRALPADSRYVWRMFPEHEENLSFENNWTDHRVMGRLIECIGEGDLPVLVSGEYENTIGFGLAPK